MYGFILQQSACPRCSILRTVRIGHTGMSLCMNCHTRWGAGSSPEVILCYEDRYAFTQAELDRLEIYRRAVAAGLYVG